MPEQLDAGSADHVSGRDRPARHLQPVSDAGGIIVPRRHKVIETTDIMLQMVASGRGVAALPRWLAEDYAGKMPLTPLRLGKKGIAKQIFLGAREADEAIDYLAAFVALARESDWGAGRFHSPRR